MARTRKRRRNPAPGNIINLNAPSTSSRHGWTVLRRRSYRHHSFPASWWPTLARAIADARERQRRDAEGQEYVVRKASAQEAAAASPLGRRRNPAALRKAAHVYGKRWVIEGFPGYRRLYVHRTNVGSYVVSDSEHLSLDSMLEIDGEYHFGTLKQLKAALARAERTRNPRRRSRRKSAKRRRNFASGWRYLRNLPDNYPLATGSPNARRPNGIHGEKIGEHRGVAIYVNRSGTALSAPSLKLYGYAYARNLMRDIDRALARKRKWSRK